MEQRNENSMLSMSVCGYTFVVTKVRFPISFSFQESNNIYFTSKITFALRRRNLLCSRKKDLILPTKCRGLNKIWKSILCYQQRIIKNAVSVVSLFPVLLARDLVQSSKLFLTHDLINLLFNYARSSFRVRQVRDSNKPRRCSLYNQVVVIKLFSFNVR